MQVNNTAELPAIPAGTDTGAEDAPLRDIRVLLVDDDEMVRDFLAVALEAEGLVVTQASNAEEAIDVLKDRTFDAVSTDKNLPGMDGIALIRHIRQNYGDLPVVLITGYGSIGSAVDALKLGAQDYLEKPLEDGRKLIDAIWRAVRSQRLTQRNKLLEERLARSQRLESVGILAGGVAHDLNNILAPIVIMPDLIVRQVKDLAGSSDLRVAEVEEELRIMEQAGLRASTVVRDLLALSVTGKYEKNPADLNAIVQTCLTAQEFRSLCNAKPGLTLQTKFEHNLCKVFVSEVHMSRVISNLVRNASEAMGAKGTITLSTSNRRLDAPHMGMEAIPAGDYVLLEVSDTGSGMPSEVLDRIFEPFFTTKSMNNTSGSGLGLSIVHRIVKDHSGFLDIRSEVGKGTTFSLYFPITQQHEEETERVLPVEGGSERILVVDDDYGQRFLARAALKQLGYTVTTACSGQEALALIHEHQKTGNMRPFDLIVMDMIMDPNLDGLETFKEVLKLCPAQKAILASGHAPTDRAVEMIALGAGWLEKPYQMKTLASALRKQLDARSK